MRGVEGVGGRLLEGNGLEEVRVVLFEGRMDQGKGVGDN